MADEGGGGGRSVWDVPEFAALALLLAVLILVAGGLAAGIAASIKVLDGSTAVQFGAQWAEPVLAMLLLGLVGLAWWQYTDWADADWEDDQAEAEGSVHMDRYRTISLLAQIGLVLTVAGTASTFGSVVAADLDLPLGAPSWAWTRAIWTGAGLLAVIVIAGAGLLIGRQLRPRESADG